MSWGPLFSPNFIKFNYSWSSSGGMFCERSGGLVCSFQIVIVIELLIFSPSFFCSQQFIKSGHWNLAGKLLCVSTMCSSWSARDQNTCMLIWGHLLWVWTGEIRGVGSWGVCTSHHVAGAEWRQPWSFPEIRLSLHLAEVRAGDALH